jgi:hypothetical protein
MHVIFSDVSGNKDGAVVLPGMGVQIRHGKMLLKGTQLIPLPHEVPPSKWPHLGGPH